MNTNKLYNYLINEFPEVFISHFSCDMLQNILEYSESMGKKEQLKFIIKIIPEITETEINEYLY